MSRVAEKWYNYLCWHFTAFRHYKELTMKTPTHSASRLITIITLVAATSLAGGYRAHPVAQYKEGDVSLGGTIDATFVGGEAKEHVFAPKSASADYAREFGVPDDGKRHQLSRLDWDIGAALIGFAGSIRYDRFSFNAGVWYGGSGDDADLEMKDYDWLAGDHNPYTEYSRSDTELTDAWMIDANVSYDFLREEAFTGYAFVGFRWQQWEWECDGWNDYCYSDYNWQWFRDKGHICDYEQQINFAYIGVGGEWKLTDALGLSAYLSWAPVYGGEDHDKHLAVYKDFKEDFDYDDGQVYAAGVALDWHVTEKASFTLAFDWQQATLHEGDMKLNDYGEGEFEEQEDGAGCENMYVAFTFGFNYAF